MAQTTKEKDIETRELVSELASELNRVNIKFDALRARSVEDKKQLESLDLLHKTLLNVHGSVMNKNETMQEELRRLLLDLSQKTEEVNELKKVSISFFPTLFGLILI